MALKTCQPNTERSVLNINNNLSNKDNLKSLRINSANLLTKRAKLKLSYLKDPRPLLINTCNGRSSPKRLSLNRLSNLLTVSKPTPSLLLTRTSKTHNQTPISKVHPISHLLLAINLNLTKNLLPKDLPKRATLLSPNILLIKSKPSMSRSSNSLRELLLFNPEPTATKTAPERRTSSSSLLLPQTSISQASPTPPMLLQMSLLNKTILKPKPQTSKPTDPAKFSTTVVTTTKTTLATAAVSVSMTLTPRSRLPLPDPKIPSRLCLVTQKAPKLLKVETNPITTTPETT
mmetsp:Transcript_16268/g.13909  ORF Transcript_16268/g.13909 Transcript_16268/m.13909 type:complete len:289 (+) Transcript_16268:1378-2244(+)